MRTCVVLPFLMLLCWCTGSLKAQTLALFRVVENGNAKIYDSTTRQFLYYNKADTVISSRHITRSQIAGPEELGRMFVRVKLNEEGTERFAQATKQSVGKQILVVVGTRLISAPVVNEPIIRGELDIAGNYNYEDAKALANTLRPQEQRRSVDPLDEVKTAIKKLDDALVLKNYEVLYELLSESLLMGHSNAYFQTKSDVIRDLGKEKIIYSKIEQHSIQEQSRQKDMYRISRIITVTGKYEGTGFSMKLAVMEIWADDQDGPQLWSRQAVKIKE